MKKFLLSMAKFQAAQPNADAVRDATVRDMVADLRYPPGPGQSVGAQMPPDCSTFSRVLENVGDDGYPYASRSDAVRELRALELAYRVGWRVPRTRKKTAGPNAVPDNLASRMRYFLHRHHPEMDIPEAVRCIEQATGNPFDALRAARVCSPATVEFIREAYERGRIPMYVYKPGKGRPKLSKNVPKAEVEARRMRREVLAIADKYPSIADELRHAVR